MGGPVRLTLLFTVFRFAHEVGPLSFTLFGFAHEGGPLLLEKVNRSDEPDARPCVVLRAREREAERGARCLQ